MVRGPQRQHDLACGERNHTAIMPPVGEEFIVRGKGEHSLEVLNRDERFGLWG